MRWAGLLVMGACGDGTGDTDGAPPTVVGYADDDLDGYIASVDCDDGNDRVHPQADEICNAIDDDCDLEIDEDPVDGLVGFIDADRDGAGGDLPLVSCPPATGWSATSDDCDDTDPDRSPASPEICNGADDDCDLAVDEGASIGAVRYDRIAEAVSAAEDGDALVLCDGTFFEGAILVDRQVTVTSVSGDPALTVIDGGGVASSVFVVDGGDLTLDGVTVKDGSGTLAVLIDGQPPALSGGAINALTGSGGPVTVRNSVLSGNSARGGGAIAAGVLTIEDSTLVGNSVTGVSPGEGGAAWIAPEGAFTAVRTLFERNEATGGGALSIHAPATLTDVEADENTALGNGGFAIVRSFEGATRATVTIERGNLHTNMANNNGGAIALVDADGTADAATVFTLNTGNEGGALELSSQIVGGAVVSWSGGTFTNNYAMTLGGAIVTQAGTAPAEVSDVVVTVNYADSQGGGLALQGGAAGATTLRDSIVSDNQAFLGAGISLVNEAEIPPMVLERVEITSNIAGSSGGGVVVFFSEVEILDSVISDNFASTSGGGLWMDARPIVDITSSDFAGNLPEDVWFVEGSTSVDLPDMDATLVCTGADATCL